MKNKKPPFEITNAIIGYVAEIAELVGKLTSRHLLSRMINRTISRQPFAGITISKKF